MNKLFCYLSLLLFVACSKINEEPSIPKGNCIKDLKYPFQQTSCLDILNIPSMYFCEIFHIDEFHLDEPSKEYMPQFCLNIGDEIKYKNESGKIIEFRVSRKEFTKEINTYNTNQKCNSDSAKTIGYCFEVEDVSQILTSSDNNLVFGIRLCTMPENDFPYKGRFGDVLHISRYIGDNRYIIEFNAEISKRTFSFDTYSLQEFYNVLNINGEEYTNILSIDVTKYQSPSFKYYYNKEIGLVAFKDTLGTIWSIVH